MTVRTVQASALLTLSKRDFQDLLRLVPEVGGAVAQASRARAHRTVGIPGA